jgi:hypothetical protein
MATRNILENALSKQNYKYLPIATDKLTLNEYKQRKPRKAQIATI